MKLEPQCCSLELAKKLKEFGAEQESLFYWIVHEGFDPYIQMSKEPLSSIWVEGTEIYSAFTAAELVGFIKRANKVDMHVAFMEVTGGVTSRTETVFLMMDIGTLTKILEYLIDNGLITL